MGVPVRGKDDCYGLIICRSNNEVKLGSYKGSWT